jgi:hypothetical protein
LTGSDQRVKDDIMNADLDMCYNNIKNIRLVRFKWNSTLYPAISDQSVLGWIAQEVETVFPKAVFESDSFGFADFKNLNSDQILKCMYGALQRTMNTVEQLRIELDALKAPVAP